MTNKKVLGNWGECFAKNYLLRNNYTFVDKNFRAARAELDLIFKKGDQYIFIEIKTRAKSPESKLDNVLSARQAVVLKKAIAFYCHEKGISLNQVRLDLIVILVNNEKRLADLIHYIDIS